MSDPYGPTAADTGLAGGALVLVLLFYAAMIAFAVWMYVRVARKAGYSGWYAALCFVPLVNIGVMVAFAFMEWPIQRELRELRERHAQAAGYAAQAYPPVPGYHAPPAAPPGPAQGYPAPAQGYPVAAEAPSAWAQQSPQAPAAPQATPYQAPYAAAEQPPFDPGPGAPSWYRPTQG